MQRFVRKCVALTGLVALIFTLAACTDDGGLTVNDNQGDEPECGENTDAECDDGERCVDEQCEPIAGFCDTSQDCAFDNQECIDNECEWITRQCNEVGDECDPDMPAAEGFACEDLGRGNRCYETCREVRVCSQGSVGYQAYCNRKERCLIPGSSLHEFDVEDAVCQPSECDDYFDTEEGCSVLREHDPDALSEGEHCQQAVGDTFVCVGAGTAEAGDSCEQTSDCAEGLGCVNNLPQGGAGEVDPAPPAPGNTNDNGFCAPICDSDEMCSDGQVCIGDDDGVVEGEGFCGDRCEPFSGDDVQCDEDTACVPVSSDDGVCQRDTTREVNFYEACDSTEQCPDSAHCVGGILEQGSFCYPLCDPTLEEVDQQHATCPQPTQNAYVQFAHFSNEADTVDVTVDGGVVATLAPGEVATGDDGFLRIELGQRQIGLQDTDTEDVLFDETVELDRNDATRLAFADDHTAEDGLTVVSSEVPRDVTAEAGESWTRYVHAIQGIGTPIDVVAAVPEEIDEDGDTVTVYNDEYPLVDNVGWGEASEFVAWPDTDDPLDLFVLPHGADNLDQAYLKYEDVDAEVDDGDILTGYAAGDVPAPGAANVMFAFVDYASAELGRQIGGNCVDLYGPFGVPLSPEIGSAICLEACTTSDDFGKGACSAEGYACSTSGTCEPAGESELGESCSGDSDCSEGLHCDQTGDESGVCRSLCQPGEQTNDSLGCESEEICVGVDGMDNLGKCRIPCEPGDDNVDTSCPENQQTCLTEGDQSYCYSSGDVAQGDTCGDQEVQNCEPGLLCAKRRHNLIGVLLEPFIEKASQENRIDEDPTCRQICEPFTGDFGDSGCPDGYACSPATPEGVSKTQGHCVPATEPQIDPLESCPSEEIGSMCGDNSFCIIEQDNQCVEDQPGFCLQFCDYERQAGCSEETVCQEGFLGGPLFGWLGLCLSDTDAN